MTLQTETVGERELSDSQLALLTKPTVHLYVTGDSTSIEAIRMLNEAGAWFDVEESSSGRLQAEWYDFDLKYEGLDDIERLANVLSSLSDSTNDDPSCENPEGSNLLEENVHIMKDLREQQRRDSEAIVRNLISGQQFMAGR